MVSEISVSIEALLRRRDEADESVEVSVSRTVIIYLATDRGWIQSLILSYSHSDTRRVRNSGDCRLLRWDGENGKSKSDPTRSSIATAIRLDTDCREILANRFELLKSPTISSVLFSSFRRKNTDSKLDHIHFTGSGERCPQSCRSLPKHPSYHMYICLLLQYLQGAVRPTSSVSHFSRWWPWNLLGADHCPPRFLRKLSITSDKDALDARVSCSILTQ